jgi:hypothetical protein
MKIVIDVERNGKELTGGWDEENLAQYMHRYVMTYGVTWRLEQDFPEYTFTNGRLEREESG